MGKRATWPNLVTAVRMVLALPIAIMVLLGSGRWRVVASALFVAGSASDLLDGYVARRYGSESSLGKWLDPLADKFLVDGCALALSSRGELSPAVSALLIGRDVLVTALRWGVRADTGKSRLDPTSLAKAKTALLFIGLSWLLLRRDGRGRGTAQWGMYLATALSVISGAGYVLRRLRTLGADQADQAHLAEPDSQSDQALAS